MSRIIAFRPLFVLDTTGEPDLLPPPQPLFSPDVVVLDEIPGPRSTRSRRPSSYIGRQPTPKRTNRYGGKMNEILGRVREKMAFKRDRKKDKKGQRKGSFDNDHGGGRGSPPRPRRMAPTPLPPQEARDRKAAERKKTWADLFKGTAKNPFFDSSANSAPRAALVRPKRR